MTVETNMSTFNDTRRGFLKILSLSAAASVLPRGLFPGRAAEGTPNIVFILADDLGWAELGCYGNDFNETPNLDRLARAGMRFTDAYAAAPVCSPTRASLMTGHVPARVGITDFLPAQTDHYLHPGDYVTLNEALSASGYHTGLIGKWHLDTDFQENPGGPRAHGWDEVIATETEYIAGGDYFYPFDKADTLSGQDSAYLTDRLTDEAIGFIRRNRGEPPFFLYLSHYAVHTKLAAPKARVEKYIEKHEARHGVGTAERFGPPDDPRHLGKPDNPYLAAMIEKMDEGVGRIMRALDDLGIAEDTVLVFMSDNGGDGRVTTNGPLRGAKTQLYEGGIRVPLIARWPGTIAPGHVCSEPVCSIDVYPTFTKIAGWKETPRHVIDGVSLLPLFEQRRSLEREALFWHYPADTMHWADRMAGAVRRGAFKLLEFYEDGRLELYNLEEDLDESNNLAEERPAKAARMHELLVGWRKGVGVDVPAVADSP